LIDRYAAAPIGRNGSKRRAPTPLKHWKLESATMRTLDKRHEAKRAMTLRIRAETESFDLFSLAKFK
jgi:hypothetical protein